MLLAKKFSVGNRAIDSEHNNLFTTINWLSEALMAGKVSAASKGFPLLDDQLHHCFEVEEIVARAINFDFTQHRFSHQCLLNKIHSIRDELLAKHGTHSRLGTKEYADSLMNCLARHIKEDGQMLKLVLDTHFYDFRPD